jgi:hypothetical protein
LIVVKTFRPPLRTVLTPYSLIRRSRTYEKKNGSRMRV